MPDEAERKIIMGKYNIHAGHCPQGQGASGAVGILKESVEDRIVKDRLITLLRNAGNTAYDCTDDTNCDQKTNLQRIVAKCNQHAVDYDISIHLNSGRRDPHGDGSTGGVEVLCYDAKTVELAKRIADAISEEFGYTKRSDKTTKYAGVKINKSLYVLRHTNSPALLIECCFVDDADDAAKWNAERCANAIYKGITEETVNAKDEWILDSTGWWYRHADGSYTTNNWEKINGNWYYFDGSGYMYTEGWHKIENHWYYMDKWGAMCTGWVYVNGNWFYLQSDGAMLENNWYKEGDAWYWLKDGGYMAKDEMLWIGNELYAFLSDGRMARTNDRGALV